MLATERPAKSRRRSWPLNLLVALISAAVALAAAELALRVAGYHPPPAPMAKGDHVLGATVPSGVDTMAYFAETHRHFRIHTNNLGFYKMADTTPWPAPGVRRIVAVGDSQTAGYCPPEENFPDLLEEDLNQGQPRPKYEVINAGVARYSPYQYYMRAKLNVLPTHPNDLLVGIYIGNDLTDLVRRDDRPYLTPEHGAFVPHPPIFVTQQDPEAPLRGIRATRLYELLEAASGGALDYQITRAGLLLMAAATTGRSPTDIVPYMLEVWRLAHIGRNLMTQSLHQFFWTRQKNSWVS